MIVVIGVSIALLVGLIHIWVTSFDDSWDKDDYCYNCPHGMCFEIPKSDKCEKWREENEDKGNQQTDNQQSD